MVFFTNWLKYYGQIGKGYKSTNLLPFLGKNQYRNIQMCNARLHLHDCPLNDDDNDDFKIFLNGLQ